MPSGWKPREDLQGPTGRSYLPLENPGQSFGSEYSLQPTIGAPKHTSKGIPLGQNEMDSSLPWDVSSPESGLAETLTARRGKYGVYSEQSRVTENILAAIEDSVNWRNGKLSVSQRYSLRMTAAKLARILNGDPEYPDNWLDISGYAELILKQLRGENP